MDGVPFAILTSRPNSHAFQDRQISLNERVKIGRSVAKAHPSPNNAIFDCKVLSRNHAVMWYEEGKFYLQDTKSSNGTFVNNQKLSKASEESEKHEIFSGDIIQFGVDVMENSKRVTHGCIMATITLFMPDGTETRSRYSGQNQTGTVPNAVTNQEIYQLSQYLQEALHREKIMQSKLADLQQQLAATADSCNNSWHVLISEDRLLSKLEVLQNQLSVCSKNLTSESLQQQIITMEDERLEYETKSKDQLKKVIDEKLVAVHELGELERTCDNYEAECKHLQEANEASQQELTSLAKSHEEKLNELAELQRSLQDLELQAKADQETTEEQRERFKYQLEQAESDRDELQVRLDDLTAIKNTDGISNGPHTNGDSESVNHEDESLLKENEKRIDGLTDELKTAQDQVDNLTDQLGMTERMLASVTDEKDSLRTQLDQAQLEIVQVVTKFATFDERAKSQGDSVEIETMQTLQEKLAELSQTSAEKIRNLEDEIHVLHKAAELNETRDDDVDSLKEKLIEAEKTNDHVEKELIQIKAAQPNSPPGELVQEKEFHNQTKSEKNTLAEELEVRGKEIEHQKSLSTQFRTKSEELESRLSDVSMGHQQYIKKTELENKTLREEVEKNTKNYDSLKQECTTLKNKVQKLESELEKLQTDNSKLTEDVSKIKGENSELRDNFSSLKASYEELSERKQSLESNETTILTNLTDTQKQAQKLQAELESERAEQANLKIKYTETLKQLETTQSSMETSRTEHSHTQEKLEKVSQDLENMAVEYEKLSNKTFMDIPAMFTSMPMMALLLAALVVVVYPWLTRSSTS